MTQETEARIGAREFPQDRFDSPSNGARVGAHRISGRIRRVWRYVVVGLIATVFLTLAGIIGLTLIGYQGSELPTDKPNGPVEEAVVPVLDPTATIVVLNGSATPSLAAGVDQIITENGWGQIVFSNEADSSDVTISAVFYSDIADLPVAEGLAEKLGGVSTYQSDSYLDLGARLVVLLGSDYAGPGFDEAALLATRLAG